MGWLDDMDAGSFTDYGGEGLPGDLPTDVGDTGGGWGGALDFLQTGWDQATNIVDAYRDVVTGGVGAALDYATGKKKGKVPGKPSLRVIPPLDTSIAIKEPGMGEAIDYGGNGTDAVVTDRTNAAHPGDPWTLPQLCANSGLTTKKVCWGIKKFGAAIIPYMVRFLQTDTSTFMAAYLSSRCIVGGRRRRGISYRQLSNARRVNHTISKMYHQLHRGRSFH